MIEIVTGVVALVIAATATGKTLKLYGEDHPDIVKGPFVTTYTVYARTGYNGADNRYVFTIKKLPSGYRCYIDRTPSYRGRSTDMNTIHYKVDNRGKYICFTKNITYLAQAKTLCDQWSNLTQRYIETGRTFES